MSQPTNHWKLGLFVVAGTLLGLAALMYLGTSGWREDRIHYVTYFNESVQGLDVGAPVKFRGVSVGKVSDIRVAPDRKHVAVICALDEDTLGESGLAGEEPGIEVPIELRAQLVSQGVTGLKYVELDFFDVSQFPLPPLPFPVTGRYIPAAVSTFKNLEEAVVGVSDRVPELLDRATRLVASLEEQKLPEKLGATLERLDRLIATLDGALVGADLDGTMASFRAVARRVEQTLARLDGERGLLASAQRATDGLGDMAALSPDLGHELIETLRDVRAASSALARLAEALEQDPDMLFKGRRVAR